MKGASKPATITPQKLEEEEANSPTCAAESRLCDLLGLGEEERRDRASFLISIGCNNVNDLEFVEESDLQALPPVLRRKLLLVAEHLRLGNSLDGVKNLSEITRGGNEVVRLNVGGHKFTTSRQTLCRVTSSYFEAMFSGRHSNNCLRTPDGEYVIDRNGGLFSYILDYLRVGSVVSLPSDQTSRKKLAVEADFYGLEAIIEAIHLPNVDTDSFVGEQVLKIRSDEEHCRFHYRNRTSDMISLNQGLVNFSDLTLAGKLPLRYDPDHNIKGTTVMDLRADATPAGTPVTVTSLGEFTTNFNRDHPNILHRLQPVLCSEPVVMAGGAVLRTVAQGGGVRTNGWWGPKSDIDLFVHCETPQEASRIARSIFYALAVDNERWGIVRSAGVINMHRWQQNNVIGEKVQIILRLYDSPAEILYGFDCDCCCCLYNGHDIWGTPRWLYSLQHGINTLNPLHAWPNKPSYELRLAKYASRGFPVVVPGLEEKCIDGRHIRGMNLRQLKGLARLIKVSYGMESSVDGDSPLDPEFHPNLRSATVENADEVEDLLHGRGGYDDLDLNVIVPSVYGDGVPSGLLWYENIGGGSADFPIMMHIRDEAWRGICQADRGFDNVPKRLVRAWDQKKRSREYLNGTMDKYDLDNMYYAEAYSKPNQLQ